MDSTFTRAVRRRLTAALLLAPLVWTGCPRKITEKVEVAGPAPKCPEVPAAAPDPPTECLGVVAVVKSAAGVEHAVVAAEGFSKSVALDDYVGKEGGKVTDIGADSATVLLPDGTAFKINKAGALRPVPCDGTEAPAEPTDTVDPAVNKRLESLARWRQQVVRGITRGYGIPVDVFYAVVLSQAEHKDPKVANALRTLGWEPSADIGRAWINRLEYRDGGMVVDGHAPNQETFAAIVKRLKSANPVIAEVSVTSQKPDSGIAFTLEVKGPAISYADLVKEGVAPAAEAWPDALKTTLDAAAQVLPKNNALGGFEADLKSIAAGIGVVLSKVERQPNSLEEGYLGVASFAVEGNGDTFAILGLLSVLRTRGVTERRIVLDPVVVHGKKFTATVRVPYVVGKVDGREPVPSLILPSLQSSRWKPARELPLDTLRDPIRAPTP